MVLLHKNSFLMQKANLFLKKLMLKSKVKDTYNQKLWFELVCFQKKTIFAPLKITRSSTSN